MVFIVPRWTSGEKDEDASEMLILIELLTDDCDPSIPSIGGKRKEDEL